MVLRETPKVSAISAWSTATTRHTAARSIRCSAAANAATPWPATSSTATAANYSATTRSDKKTSSTASESWSTSSASGTPRTRRPPSITCVPTDTNPTPPTSPGLHRSDTPASTSTAATAPPAAHQPPASDRYAPTDSGSCTNPRHGPKLRIQGGREMTKAWIDINCDMSEGFGTWMFGDDIDAQMMPMVSSVNVAAGFHAGDPNTMARTVSLAKEYGVGVGVHPGFRDLVGFGRRHINAGADELVNDSLYQLGALREFTRYHRIWLCQVCVAPSEAGIAGLSGSTLRLTGQLLSGLSGPT